MLIADAQFRVVCAHNTSTRADGVLEATGHRICDVAAIAGTLDEAIATAYANIRRIRSLGSYHRNDVGKSLWPPGNG